MDGVKSPVKTKPFEIRPATADDLPGINRLIESSVLNWPMEHRVKRLSVPVLTYDAIDQQNYDMFVCVNHAEIIGVAAFDPNHAPGQGLLHGLYVLPIVQSQGIGRALMDVVFDMAGERGLGSVHVRAERVSAGYFEHQQLAHLEPANDAEYPYRFVKSLGDAA